MERPSVSVVIAWVNPLDLLVPGLDSLTRQRDRRPDEIIVVTRHPESEQARLRALYPGIVVLPVSSSAPITALRSIGLRRARGSVVAITEDHCVPALDWIGRIERHVWGQGCQVVGGVVENASTARRRDWAAFLTEYSGAIRSASSNATGQGLPGNNVAYLRELVDGLSSTLDQGQWESFYHERLVQRGVQLAYDPDLVVYHRRPFDFRYFVKQRYHFGRSFAAMRSQSLPAWRRAMYAAGSLVLPPLLLLRGLRTLLRKQRFVGLYLSCLPLVGVYVTVGALGEMLGCLLGGGDSLRRVE